MPGRKSAVEMIADALREIGTLALLFIVISKRRGVVARLIPFLVVAATFGCARTQRIVTDGAVITNVTVISPERAAPLLHADVVIRNGRIAEIGSNLVANAPARWIDGTGRFLIPGLI